MEQNIYNAIYKVNHAGGCGSCFYLKQYDLFVTNYHVVEGFRQVAIQDNDKNSFLARVVMVNSVLDIALLSVEGDFSALPDIRLSELKEVAIGQKINVAGYPFGMPFTVTEGTVSSPRQLINNSYYIQTDAAINQGNSGGALVNAAGELIGINAALFSPTGSNTGYGFAIPTSIMKKVVADIKQFGTVQRVKLGVSVTTLTEEPGDTQVADKDGKKWSEIKSDARKRFGVVDGLWVREIVDGGSAAGSDIKVDDVIIGIDNKAIHKFADLQEALAKYRPGDKVKVKLMRDKKEKTVEVTLKNEQGTTKVVKDAGMDILGAAFKPVSDDLKKQLNLGYGLQVTGVSNGKMADAGIRKGFIILKANGQQMRTVEDLENVMKAAVKSPDQVLFLTGIFPSGKRGNFAVDLTQE